MEMSPLVASVTQPANDDSTSAAVHGFTQSASSVKKPPLLISLEGNIGAGKSTLLEKLADKLAREEADAQKKWVFLREPVHIWETIRDEQGETMLSKFYADTAKYAFAFQIMAYTTRLHELRRLLREHPDCYGIICERSLEADKHIFAKMLHADGTMEDVMYQIYDRYFAEYESEFQLSGLIYVDADPAVCFERIKQRSREGESSIPLSYLETCRDYHETWLMEGSSPNKTPKLLHLHTNSPATFDPDDADDVGHAWLQCIVDFLDHIRENWAEGALVWMKKGKKTFYHVFFVAL